MPGFLLILKTAAKQVKVPVLYSIVQSSVFACSNSSWNKMSGNSSILASPMILWIFHLRQLDLWADVEGVCEIPLEDKVVCCVRQRLNHHKTDLSNLIIEASVADIFQTIEVHFEALHKEVQLLWISFGLVLSSLITMSLKNNTPSCWAT